MSIETFSQILWIIMIGKEGGLLFAIDPGTMNLGKFMAHSSLAGAMFFRRLRNQKWSYPLVN